MAVSTPPAMPLVPAASSLTEITIKALIHGALLAMALAAG